jgi:eukaryotic-like serine/threonine-protein kinase
MCPRNFDDTLRDADGPPSSAAAPAGLVTGPFVLPPEALAGPTSIRYAELGVLGEGGMGKVHLCRDERIGREVAMKVILPQLQANPSTRARFVREASVQGQLEHPSIVPVHDLGVTPEGATFFTMKRVRGLTLEAVLADLRNEVLTTADRFTSRRLLGAFVNVCLAVDFAHSKGVVHRDLKPANLMLGDFGEVYLLDWGIAKLADERADLEGIVQGELRVGATPTPKTAAGALLGTLGYMAPEQVLGEEASVQSDIFALGAILFEILAGTPLRGEDTTFVAIAKGKHDARCSVRCPERLVAPELEAICVRATAVEPRQRFASARLLAEAVERFLEGDRDIVRRRELAAAHVSKARGIVTRSTPTPTPTDDETAAAGVMRELGSALALDPDNVEARAMVVEALTAVPREMPLEVREALERRAGESVSLGARRWPIMLAGWVAFAPLLYLAGLKDLRGIAVGLGLMVLATVLGVVRARRGTGTWMEYASFGATALAMVAAGRAFGPFVLVPTLLATFATALQLHPNRNARRIALGISLAALVGAVLLELSGLLPRVNVRTEGLLISASSSARDLPITAVMLMMNVAVTLTTALTVSSVRAELTRAEARLLLHSWQVRGMMPVNVAQRSSERRVPAARSGKRAG